MLDRYLPENEAARLAVGVAATALAVLIVTQFVMPGPGTGDRGTPAAILFSGLVTGVLTAVSAVGLVVVYRALRIINFAQVILGVVGGVMLQLLLQLTGVPFLLAFVVCVALGGLVGAVLGVFTLRFFHGSRLFLTVVTIVAVPVVLFSTAYLINLPIFPDANERTSESLIQTPEDIQRLLPLAGLDFTVGGLELQFGFAHLFALEVGALAIAAVWAFFRYTKTGVAIRAISENPERAALLGIGVGGVSIVVWTIAGALSGITIGISYPLVGQQGGSGAEQALFLLPLLTAAAIGRFTKLGVTVTAAIAITVLQSAFAYSFRERSGLFYVLLFVAILVALALQRSRQGRSETAEVSWSATDEPRPVPKELAGITGVRLARLGLVSLLLIGAALFPFLATVNRTQLMGVAFITAIAVLSLVVLTGWAGQVSLGQWGFVAVGAVVGGALTTRVGLPFWIAVPVTAAITGGIAALIGVPALRVRGLFLMIATFGFAAAVQVSLFNEQYFGWLLPADGVERPTLFFFDFQDETSMYFLSLASLVLALVIVRNLRRSRVGRILIALRENEANVQAFGISVMRAKLMAFTIAGALCGFAGVVLAHHQQAVSEGSFTAFASFNVFIQAVIGGVSSPAGALLGSAYFTLSSDFVAGNDILTSLFNGWLPMLIIFVAPGGFISLFNAVRDSALRIVAQRRQIVVPSLFADYDPDVLENRLIPLAEPDGVSGLAALPVDQRFALSSELYQGTGERVIDKLGPAREAQEKVAIGAAARNASEFDADSTITEDS